MGLLDEAFRKGREIIGGYRHRGLERPERAAPEQHDERQGDVDGNWRTVSMLPDLTPIARAFADAVAAVVGALAIGLINLGLAALVVGALLLFFGGFGAALIATITGVPVVLPIIGTIAPAVGLEVLAIAGFALTWLVIVPLVAVAAVLDARRSRRKTGRGLEQPPMRRNSAPLLGGLAFGGLGVAGAFIQFNGLATFAVIEAFAIAWPAMLALAAFSFWVWWRAERRDQTPRRDRP